MKNTATLSAYVAVALLAEGVDRNHANANGIQHLRSVALLAEGVDRNSPVSVSCVGTWSVALLAEGVDRNCCAVGHDVLFYGRPPRGGRG